MFLIGNGKTSADKSKNLRLGNIETFCDYSERLSFIQKKERNDELIFWKIYISINQR